MVLLKVEVFDIMMPIIAVIVLLFLGAFSLDILTMIGQDGRKRTIKFVIVYFTAKILYKEFLIVPLTYFKKSDASGFVTFVSFWGICYLLFVVWKLLDFAVHVGFKQKEKTEADFIQSYFSILVVAGLLLVLFYIGLYSCPEYFQREFREGKYWENDFCTDIRKSTSAHGEIIPNTWLQAIAVLTKIGIVSIFSTIFGFWAVKLFIALVITAFLFKYIVRILRYSISDFLKRE